MSLKISKLSKRFNDIWVLRDVSFEAKRGEVLGIIGKNSCGKSTLLRLIYGSEKANSGEILFDGRDITKLSVNERGFCFQEFQDSNSWKNVFSSIKKHQISESKRQIDLISKQLSTADSLILLDNPFSNLDKTSQKLAFEQLLKIVSEKQLIVILATNNEEEIFSLCTNVAVLADGEIIQIASPREIYEKPNSVAVASSLGNNNLITSRRVTFNNQNSLEFHTLIGDHRLEVDKVEKSALGAITNNVTLAIRPEHISISFGASFPEDNLLKAKIESINYLGATTCLKLNANGLLLEALVLRLVGLNIGDECMVGLPPDRISVLKH